MIRSTLFLLLLVWLLSGCATSRPVPVAERESASPAPATGNEPAKSLVEEILSADAGIEPEPHTEVPLEINANVQRWIDYFSIKDHERFATFLERGLRYKDIVLSILKEEGVPAEMYYLAMIESGYITYARSRARAVGAWQFIGATGRRYGLRNNRDLDERRDIVRSTRAAARYLKDLHDEFSSWYLALAAYNAGEGRIRRGIRKGKSTDFWTLVNKRALPRETMDYVPKFLAAVVIGNHTKKYGFAEIPEKKLPTLKAVALPGSVHLNDVAKLAQLSLEEIKEYNPHLIREITPRDSSSYEIWIPQEQASALESVAQTLPRYTAPLPSLRQRAYAALPKAKSVAHRYHRVRHGETLSSIAQRYRISVTTLKRLNRLKGSRIAHGQTLRVHPKPI